MRTLSDLSETATVPAPSIEARRALESVQARIAAACARSGRDARSVTLIGASKTVSLDRLRDFFAAGLRDVGENYVQEGTAKIAAWCDTQSTLSAGDTQSTLSAGDTRSTLPVRWHGIGALQRNKARDAVRLFDWVHSVDRLPLARALDDAARAQGKIQNVLLQVNLGDEESKAGCAIEELETLARESRKLENLAVRGLMCLPPPQDETEATRRFFQRLRALAQSTLGGAGGWELSMGMSRDFEIAIEEGATMIRVGSDLFGARQYKEKN